MATKAKTKKSLLDQVLALPLEDRADIAYELMKSLDDDGEDYSEEANRAYWAEVMRRVEEAVANPHGGTPWQEVHERILAELGDG